MGDFFQFDLRRDFVNLVYLPFIVATFIEIKNNRAAIFDDQLTVADRAILKRATIFLLLPLIVLVHELGHYLAALSVGATVLEFHYGPATGFVRILHDRTDSQMLWIAFAGNLVQMVIGLLSLLVSLFVRSPAMVAICVYFGLFALADTAVFYALLSALGLYGDWIEIYASADRAGVLMIGIFHVCILLLLAFLIYGDAPRQWFAKKTIPDWYEQHRILEKQAEKEPSYENLEALCVSWFRAGFPKKAEKVLDRMAVQGDRPEIRLMRARIWMSRGKVEAAARCFEELIDDESLNEKGRARLCVEAGEIMVSYRDIPAALKLFSKGVELDPLFGEAGLFKAIMLNSLNRHAEALESLPLATHPHMVWSDPSNADRVHEEAERARAALEAGSKSNGRDAESKSRRPRS